jgi:hypothetical protein
MACARRAFAKRLAQLATLVEGLAMARVHVAGLPFIQDVLLGNAMQITESVTAPRIDYLVPTEQLPS